MVISGLYFFNLSQLKESIRPPLGFKYYIYSSFFFFSREERLQAIKINFTLRYFSTTKHLCYCLSVRNESSLMVDKADTYLTHVGLSFLQESQQLYFVPTNMPHIDNSRFSFPSCTPYITSFNMGFPVLPHL